MLSVDPAQVDDVDSIQMSTWAGQESDPSPIRIGNTGATDLTILVYSTDPNVTISLDARRGFGSALDYPSRGIP